MGVPSSSGTAVQVLVYVWLVLLVRDATAAVSASSSTLQFEQQLARHHLPGLTLAHSSVHTSARRGLTASIRGWRSEHPTNADKLMIAASPSTYSNLNLTDTGGLRLVAPPGDQGPCAVCVGFVIAAAAETAMAAALQVDVAQCSFSVQSLYFCGKTGWKRDCQTGWTFGDGLTELMERGASIPTTACLPYKPYLPGTYSTQHHCQGTCNTPSQHAGKGKFTARLMVSIWEAMAHIRQHGSVVTRFDVYSDFKVFFSTKNNLKAVYKPSRNASLIYPHAILVVGYNTNSRYWIAKNSWGRGWADGGFFKVAFGVCSVMTLEAYGVVFSPTKRPDALLLPVTPSDKASCYRYKARKADYLSKIAWLAGIPLDKLLLDTGTVTDLSKLLVGTPVLLCNPQPGSTRVLGQPANKAVASSCPQLPLYIAQQQRVVVGRRLFQATGVASLAALADICDTTPTCSAFDTSGWLRFNVSHAAVQQMVPLNTSLAGCSATYIKSDPSMVARDGSIGSLRSGLVLEGQDALGVDSVIKRTRSVQAKYLRALAAPAVIRKGYKRMPYPGLKAQASQEFGVDAEEALMLAALPDAWDNTNPAVVGGPAFVAPARDQGACSSCVAFAVAAAAEAALATAQNLGSGATPKFSEQSMFFCKSGSIPAVRSCQTGWTFKEAVTQLMTDGIVQAKCMPYKPPVYTLKQGYNPCTQTCTSKSPGEYMAELIDDNLLRAKRAIIESGGVLTAMWLYADLYGLPFNPDSVYTRIKDIPPEESIAAHAVFIVGYNDTGRYWLVKNSWGPDWPAKGRGGVFKVAYGESGILSPGYTYAVTWDGPGRRPRTVLAPLAQESSGGACKLYTAKQGDTLLSIWSASMSRLVGGSFGN